MDLRNMSWRWPSTLARFRAWRSLSLGSYVATFLLFSFPPPYSSFFSVLCTLVVCVCERGEEGGEMLMGLG